MDRINIFNPVRVFRDVFSASWCQNVKTRSEPNLIPIDKSMEVPELVLECLPDQDWFVAVIPILRTWEPISLMGHRSLGFIVSMDGGGYPDVGVTLMSGAPSKESPSREVRLANYGVMPGAANAVSVSLSEFAGAQDFEMEKARVIKFIGYGRFNLRLSKIILE